MLNRIGRVYEASELNHAPATPFGCHQTIPRAVYHASLGRRVASRASFKFTTHKYLSLWCQLCGGSVRVDREVAAEAGEEERAIIRLFVKETEVRSVKATINYTIPTPEECPLGDGDAEEVVPDGEVMNIGVVGGAGLDEIKNRGRF